MKEPSPEESGWLSTDVRADAAERGDSSVEPSVDGAGDGWDIFEETVAVDSAEDLSFACSECATSEIAANHALPAENFKTSLPRVRENPLRGFITSYVWGPPANTLSDQMEFLYLPLSSVWNSNGPTLETGLEPFLVAAQGRGHHAVVRLYIDYPNKPTGLPAYLMEQVGCQPYQDHGGGCSPDYDHPLLVEAMVGVLEAMGTAYDGDPRLGVVQIGLLGFWGEWHTYPHTEWFPTEDTQKAVLNAAHNAFSITQLQVRRPAAHSVNLRIGFHDDSFAYSTLGDVGWFFHPQLVASGAEKRWEEVMIGGELRPELQSLVFEPNYVVDTYAQDVNECIETTHASYLLNYKGFSENGVGYTGAELEAAEAAALTMGYRFEIVGASLTLADLHEGKVDAKITVTLAQTGNAPFYYEIFPALEVEGMAKWLVKEEDLKTLLPGQTRDVVFELGSIDVTTLGNAFKMHLSSEMVLPGQQVHFATTTPWTAEGAPTALAWNLGCAFQGQEVPLGTFYGQDDEGCLCVCDVDGVMRNCAGQPCI